MIEVITFQDVIERKNSIFEIKKNSENTFLPINELNIDFIDCTTEDFIFFNKAVNFFYEKIDFIYKGFKFRGGFYSSLSYNESLKVIHLTIMYDFFETYEYTGVTINNEIKNFKYKISNINKKTLTINDKNIEILYYSRKDLYFWYEEDKNNKRLWYSGQIIETKKELINLVNSNYSHFF